MTNVISASVTSGSGSCVASNGHCLCGASWVRIYLAQGSPSSARLHRVGSQCGAAWAFRSRCISLKELPEAMLTHHTSECSGTSEGTSLMAAVIAAGHVLVFRACHAVMDLGPIRSGSRHRGSKALPAGSKLVPACMPTLISGLLRSTEPQRHRRHRALRLLTLTARRLVTGSGAIAVTRTMGGRCSRTGSWRRSARR
jgi:hypothetical protein